MRGRSARLAHGRAAVLALLLSTSAATDLSAQRLVVTPASRSVMAGDSLRLRAQLVDASGRAVPGAQVSWRMTGGRFEGTVDSTGLVRAGSVGTLTAAAIALVPGAKPVIERVDVTVLPGAAARIEVAPRPARLAIGQRVRLHATVYSSASDLRSDQVRWTSGAPSVARISRDGVLQAVAPGRATIEATVGGARETLGVEVAATPVARLELRPRSAQVRTGDVLRLTAVALDARGREIPGLMPSWSFAPGDGMVDAGGAFVAYAPGAYQVTASVGTRTAEAVVRATDRGVRRDVKVVGKLLRKTFATSEVSLHPNGNVAYLGTILGGDRLYAVDISNPANPSVADSLVLDARSVNDLMTTPDGNYLVATREGASNRRNGIVIADTRDPLHPKLLSEFTQGVTAGVHSAFVHWQPKFGTHVYLTNDGTGAVHVVDINDPAHPRQVAVWQTPRADAGRYLHDIDVQDGLLYGSWWNDGLVILDVGNGIKGGTPSTPVLVSQYKYDLDALYRDVEAQGGKGFIRGTHTAWRFKDYVLIADEVFGNNAAPLLYSGAITRAHGRLHVLDVKDIEHPKLVAWYEPEYGGVHNVWVAGDTLYMGAYNAGFKAFDLSGELRGDLRAQGREMGEFMPMDSQGRLANVPFTWGVVVNGKDGLAWVSDFNSGLWALRLEPKPALVP